MKKRTALLTNPHYNTHKTSLLVFQFEPSSHLHIQERVQSSSFQHAIVENKEIVILDEFFLEEEAADLRNFSQKAPFSRNSYGSPESKESGEAPARSMNNKERWAFFSKPPRAVLSFYQLLEWLAHRMDVEICTLPWELSDGVTGSPAVIANFLENFSLTSMELGKHSDYQPDLGLPFGIPLLYSSEGTFHPNCFANGERGKPWLISAMLYSTSENYLPEYRMGTVYYRQDGQLAHRNDCLNARLVFFEGDLPHSIEASNLPADVKTWRVSYVFKLFLNPRRPEQSIKRSFYALLSSASSSS